MMTKFLLIAGLCAIISLNNVDAECGGPTTDINSTAVLPSVVPAGLECVWFFKQDKNASMYIFVREFHIQPGDTFTVYNGAKSDGVNVDKIVTLVGSADPSVVVFAAQTRIQLTFKSGPVQTNATRSFQVNYSTTGCDVKLNAYRSAIAAPIYLKQPGSVNCTYDISSDHNASVALSFSKLNISKGSVIVWDGEGKASDPVINYTNPTHTAEDVISQQGKLTMQVVFSTARANQTMNAGFETGHECTETIVVNGPMTLSSPGYPSKYYSHQHCRWILKVPKEKSDYNIKAKFVDLDLGSPYDYVVVNAGGSRSSPSLGTFRKGSPLDTVMASGNGMMYIELGTDETPGARGFQIALMLSPFDQTFIGSGHIELSPKINVTAEEMLKTLSSKADDYDIFYQLIAEEGQQVEVNVSAKGMFPTSVIRIYDGNTLSNPLLARLRSDTPFFPVQSTGRNVLILLSGFKRNGTITPQKFAADFKSVQQGAINSLSEMSGILQLDATSATTNKTWLINTYESTNQVALRIHSLDLNPGEILNIYDGLSTTDKKIVKLTNDVTNMPVVYAKQMRVEYITQTKFNSLKKNVTDKPVFSASYEQIAGTCGGQVSGTSGTIMTPEWPNRYPYNAKCGWVFQPVKNSTLHLSFESFTLFEEHTLIITVQDFHTYANKTSVNVTSVVVANVTGEDIPSDFMFNMDDANVTSRQVMVNFSSKYQRQSRSAEVGAGFQMKYEYLNSNCSMNVTAGSIIKTPNWPNAVTTDLSCLWIISEPPLDEKDNTTVNVLSYTLELQHVTKDNSRYKEECGFLKLLNIHDGGAMTSPIVPVKLTDGKTKSMQSRTNKLWIKFSYTKLNSTKNSTDGFAFRLTFNKQGCSLKKQCANGICMQDSWKCNGVDDCGDMSDEKDCTCSLNGGKKQYSGLVLGMSIVATIILTLILVFVIPIIYKRIRYPNYGELRDLMAPVPS